MFNGTLKHNIKSEYVEASKVENWAMFNVNTIRVPDDLRTQ